VGHFFYYTSHWEGSSSHVGKRNELRFKRLRIIRRPL